MKPWLVATLDLVWAVVFAAVGRASHGEDLGPAGLARTAWPFATGWLVGWVLLLLLRRTQRRPRGLRPLGLAAGALVWVPTVALGMALRVASGAGVELSFVVVATVVLGVFLLGWRAAAALAGRARRRDVEHAPV